jgi:hypothetical protein
MLASAQFRAKRRKCGKARRHALKINGSYLSNTPPLETTTRKIVSDRHDDVGRVAAVLPLQAGPVGKEADAEPLMLHSAVDSGSLPWPSRFSGD